MSVEKKDKDHWLGTPWTWLVLGLLTWPLHIAVLALCVKYRLSPWVANLSAIVLLFGGVILTCCTVLAAWQRTPRQRMFILGGSIITWVVVGRILSFWFGHLAREVSR
jgi:hypothetical protein